MAFQNGFFWQAFLNTETLQAIQGATQHSAILALEV